MNSLLWLNQLHDCDQPQVGVPLVRLSQALQQGDPVQPGVVVPTTLMQTVWLAITELGTDRILQDFPHLQLQFSPQQPVRVQAMAQQLQSGILAAPFPAPWQSIWQSQLQQWEPQSLWLTAYVWTEGSSTHSTAAQMLHLAPRSCQPQVEALEQSLKGLWSELFQAQRLHILQHLELRPDQLRMSILVQPLSNIQAIGWLKLGEHQFQLQVQPSGTLSLESSDANFPNCYRYHLQTQQIQSVTELKPGLFSEPMLQRVMNLARQWQAQWPTDTVLSWILTADQKAADASIQLLGPLIELPFPMVMQEPQISLSRPSSSTETDTLDPQSLPSPETSLLGVGCGVASGCVSAPVTLLNETCHSSPKIGSILVAHHLEPNHLPWLATAAGLICEIGSFTSHSAIMARELGYPAVVGVVDIMQQVQSGQWVTLDGDHGRVYKAEAEKAEAEYSVQPLEPLAVVPAPRPQHSTQIKVLVNISSPQRLASPELRFADGVGLVRSEWLLLRQLAIAGSTSTTETVSDFRVLFQQQGEQLAAIAQAVDPRPVFYRSADLDHWSWNQLSMGTKEAITPDTVLGVRGTLRYLESATLLEQELMMLKALLRQGINNLRLILPFVRSPQEVAFCRAKMQAVGITSDTELPLWMMAEVPSVLFGLAQYRGLGLTGIMIGTNDLAQLLLGIDRNHPKFQTVLTQNGTVLQEALQQLVQQASSLGLASILCSSIPQHHTATFLAPLIKAGLSGISIEPGAVATVYAAIIQAEQELGIVYDSTATQS
jgi:pyruvate, water dikinase